MENHHLSMGEIMVIHHIFIEYIYIYDNVVARPHLGLQRMRYPFPQPRAQVPLRMLQRQGWILNLMYMKHMKERFHTPHTLFLIKLPSWAEWHLTHIDGAHECPG